VRERLAVQFGERAWLRAAPDGNGHWVAQIRLPALRAAPAIG